MGRKPTPTKLNLIRGNPGKRPINNQEPLLKGGRPKIPKELKGIARREWERVVKVLHGAGILTIVDRTALQAYCQAYQRWLEAEKLIDEQGLVITVITENGNRRMKNPAVAVAKDALSEIRSWCSEFGMTPSSRSRIKVPRKEEKNDAYDKWKATKEA